VTDTSSVKLAWVVAKAACVTSSRYECFNMEHKAGISSGANSSLNSATLASTSALVVSAHQSGSFTMTASDEISSKSIIHWSRKLNDERASMRGPYRVSLYKETESPCLTSIDKIVIALLLVGRAVQKSDKEVDFLSPTNALNLFLLQF
jgi:hypothetical protein